MKIEKIIKEFQKWKLDNFWELYEEFVGKIYNFIYYKLLDKELSEDITSEVFFKIMKSCESFSGTTIQEFSSWSYKIAYNSVIDHYRTQKENTALEDIENIKWYEYDIAWNIDNKNKLGEVLDYLNKIDENQKTIFIMRIWDDLSYKEISDITWKSVDNCKKIVSRLVAQLEANINYLFLFILITEIVWIQK